MNQFIERPDCCVTARSGAAHEKHASLFLNNTQFTHNTKKDKAYSPSLAHLHWRRQGGRSEGCHLLHILSPCSRLGSSLFLSSATDRPPGNIFSDVPTSCSELAVHGAQEVNGASVPPQESLTDRRPEHCGSTRNWFSLLFIIRGVDASTRSLGCRERKP